MNKQDMKLAGAAHFEQGKKLCPSDLIEIDKSILDFTRSECAHINDHMARQAARARMYSELRGAFNKAWNRAHCASVFSKAA